MKKILLGLLIGLFLISLASAAISDLGTFKQGECINLPQTCPDCSYNKISRIIVSPGSEIVLDEEVSMQKDDTFYNYTFCNTTSLGVYSVNGYGDLGGVKTTWNYLFRITPSGTIQNSILNNPVLIILFLLALIFLGFGVGFKISSLGFIGSILLILSGIYTMIYGFNNVTNLYTRGSAIAIIGLGIIIMFISAYEWLPGKE